MTIVFFDQWVSVTLGFIVPRVTILVRGVSRKASKAVRHLWAPSGLGGGLWAAWRWGCSWWSDRWWSVPPGGRSFCTRGRSICLFRDLPPPPLAAARSVGNLIMLNTNFCIRRSRLIIYTGSESLTRQYLVIRDIICSSLFLKHKSCEYYYFLKKIWECEVIVSATWKIPQNIILSYTFDTVISNIFHLIHIFSFLFISFSLRIFIDLTPLASGRDMSHLPNT